MTDDTTSRETIPRRKFLLGAGLAGTAVATGLTQPAAADPAAQTPPATASTAAPQAEPLLILNETEHAFIVAAVDTLIPADELSPSGSDCGCAVYIDRQLASAWGGGAKTYRAGPYFKGKPEQGYQLALTPAEFFAAGIAAANAWSRKMPRLFSPACSRSLWRDFLPTRSMAAIATRSRGGCSAFPACRRPTPT